MQAMDTPDLLKRWQLAFNDSSVEELVSLYSQDAALWGTLSDTHRRGHVAIGNYFAPVFEYSQRQVIFNDIYVRQFDKIIVCSGHYTFSWLVDGQLLETPARFTFCLAHLAGVWQIVEHHSSALPQS